MAVNSKDVLTSSSRVGNVKDFGRVCIEIRNDGLRLPLLKKRGLNPFFALAEFSWFMNGSNMLVPLQYFIPTYVKYSDDTRTLNGAYGYRLRRSERDQIEATITELQMYPESRRAVLSMWDISDLGSQSLDIPCNTSVMFKIRNGYLDMTVINRSNDLFLGLPYNVTLFFLLQCYVARRLNCKIGTQCHYIDSLHLYSKHFTAAQQIVDSNPKEDVLRRNQSYGRFELAEYVDVEHAEVTDLNFSKIKSPLFRDFYSAIASFRDNGNFHAAIDMLPQNALGYAAYLWFSERKGYDGYGSKKFEFADDDRL